MSESDQTYYYASPDGQPAGPVSKQDADKTRPAIITFTHKKGNTYTGTIKGYMVNDRMPSQGTRLSGITITLPQ